MKNFLAMSLGALLIVGSTTGAAAAGRIDFNGVYRMQFNNVWNYNYGAKGASSLPLTVAGGAPYGVQSNLWDRSPNAFDRHNDSGFFNRLQLNFAFHATDEVSVFWRLRAPNSQRWGTNDLTAVTDYVYGQVNQDWGTAMVGRFYGGSDLGLVTAGLKPAGVDDNFTFPNPFQLGNRAFDGIRYANRWDSGFHLLAQFNRLTTTPTVSENADLFTLQPSYFWEGGAAGLGLSYLRDRSGDSNPSPLALTDVILNMFYINPFITHDWGNGWRTSFAGKAGWGQLDGWGPAPNTFFATNVDYKVSGYAAYADVNYNYGQGNVNLAAWWASGNKENWNKNPPPGTSTKASAGDFHGMVGMGQDFAPLMLAYGGNALPRVNNLKGGAVQIANAHSGHAAQMIRNSLNDGGDSANHWAAVISGNQTLTNDINLTYALGYLSLVKNRQGTSKDIGTEIDLGLHFKLLDNLEFRTTVAYLFAGKALDGVDDRYFLIRNSTGTPSTTGSPSVPVGYKADDAMGWYNCLVFSF